MDRDSLICTVGYDLSCEYQKPLRRIGVIVIIVRDNNSKIIIVPDTYLNLVVFIISYGNNEILDVDVLNKILVTRDKMNAGINYIFGNPDHTYIKEIILVMDTNINVIKTAKMILNSFI